MSLDGITSKAWASVTVPGQRPAATMSTEAERQLLFYLAADYFADAGHIVDTGCLLGGSTLALGHGLLAWEKRAGRKPVHGIHAYDLFTAQAWMFKKHLPKDAYAVGQDLLPGFTANIAPVARFVTAHPGDISQQKRPGGQIEILFVDVAKTPDLSDFVVREFFPALIPGHSLVIQQDYLYEGPAAAWLHITMEYYGEYFRMLTDTERNSVVFLYEREIPKDRLLDRTLATLPASEKLGLLERARGRFAGAQAAVMLGAGCAYLRSRWWSWDDGMNPVSAGEAAAFSTLR